MICKLIDVCYINNYKQLAASTLESLRTPYGNIKLLPSSKDYNWVSTSEIARKYICNGEIITLGKARYANIKYNNGPFVSSNNVIIESNNQDKILTKYIYYYCLKNHKTFYVEGTTYPKFDITTFSNSFIIIPSVNEQSKIIFKLDYLCNQINKEEKNKMFLDELIKSRFNEMFGDPILNDKGLDLAKLSSISRFKSGKAIKTGELVSENDGSLYPCYGGNGLRGYINRFSHDGDYPIIGRQGALAGNVNYATGKFYATEHAVVANPSSRLNPLWYFYALTYFDLMRFQSGAAQPGLAVEKLNELELPLPNIDLQNEFADFVNLIDKLKFNVQKRIDLYQELLDKKMDEYFG